MSALFILVVYFLDFAQVDAHLLDMLQVGIRGQIGLVNVRVWSVCDLAHFCVAVDVVVVLCLLVGLGLLWELHRDFLLALRGLAVLMDITIRISALVDKHLLLSRIVFNDQRVYSCQLFCFANILRPFDYVRFFFDVCN